ncbi:MAG: NAD-binding protein, partial [Bacteroidaceae bacterium]|nr:NAD-binding protein [Bacteroidaceae bacterium]
RNMQAFVALTPDTEANIIACLAAKQMGVLKTIAVVENMDYVDMAEKLDIGTIINKKMIAASHIYQMMLDTDVASVKCLTIANADVSEFIVGEGSLVTKTPVRELQLPAGVTLGGMVRDGVGYPIYGNTELRAGDSVVVFSLSGLIKKMDPYFCKPASVMNRIMSAFSS